jgi:hypothetical protein
MKAGTSYRKHERKFLLKRDLTFTALLTTADLWVTPQVLCWMSVSGWTLVNANLVLIIGIFTNIMSNILRVTLSILLRWLEALAYLLTRTRDFLFVNHNSKMQAI